LNVYRPRILCVYILLIIFSLLAADLSAADSSPNESSTPLGSICGTVIDIETGLPVPGASVSIIESTHGAIADSSGYFCIMNIPAGKYNLKITHVGYKESLLSDVIVHPGSTASINPEMKVKSLEGKNIKVTSGYFPLQELQPLSSLRFSSEDIQRTDATIGDLSRIISVLPGVHSGDDRYNNLIVRGGNPVENSFYIDGIQVGNINHFPSQVGSGGPIGLININLIDGIDFYTGGFPARYGECLSSVVSIETREGNRKEFDGQLNIDITGVGGVFEGPIDRDDGSWLIGVRHGFAELLMDLLDIDMVLGYEDIFGKLIYDIGRHDRLTVLGLYGSSKLEINEKIASDISYGIYGDHVSSQNVIGASWRHDWTEIGYSEFALSGRNAVFDYSSYFTTNSELNSTGETSEKVLSLTNNNYFRLSDRVNLTVGGNFDHLDTELDYFIGYHRRLDGVVVDSLKVDQVDHSRKIGLHSSVEYYPFSRFKTNLGIRWDYFSYTENQNLAARIGISYELAKETYLSAAYGQYYQNLPLYILSQNSSYRDFPSLESVHYILGLSRNIGEDFRLNLEWYNKEYKNFPMDRAIPHAFVLDEIIENYGYFDSHTRMVPEGEGYSRGVELMVQKSPGGSYYGFVGLSYSRSRYRALNGDWHSRITDRRFSAAIEAGLKITGNLEFKCQWHYAGGIPYTPYNENETVTLDHIVFNWSEAGTERMPAYHVLNIRFDHRLNFGSGDLTWYMSVLNIYNRQNVIDYYWDDSDNEIEEMHQMSILPVIGLSYDF